MLLPENQKKTPLLSLHRLKLLLSVWLSVGLLIAFILVPQPFGVAARAVTRTMATTLQLTPVADNTLYEDTTGSLSNALGQHLYIGNIAQPSPNRRRAALKFDLSSIPAGATINSATLSLNMSKTLNSAGMNIKLHRLLKNWGEGTSNGASGAPGPGEGNGAAASSGDVTWLHTFFNTQLWSTPGGDFVSTPSATTFVQALGTYQWTGAGLLADVQQWRSDAATNFGWLLIGDESTLLTAMQFDSKENTNAANRPLLTIDYAVAEGADLSITKTDGVTTYTPTKTNTYTIVVSNAGPGAVTGATVTDNLPPQVTSWTWSCAAEAGATCATGPTTSSTNFTDTVSLAAGKKVTYTVTATIGAAATGALVNTATVTAPVGTIDTNSANNTATDTDTFAPLLDTLNVQANAEKAGSLLVFPYYYSKSQPKADTSLTLSNIGTQVAKVHVFFIDGTSCNSFDQFLCLTPNASLAFDASDYDPETKGWLLAVAVDDQGRPVMNNVLIGSAFVSDGEYVGNYGAEAFRANSTNLATINNNTATLNFDGLGYDAVPNQLVGEIKSPLDAIGQRIVTVGLSGDLTKGQMSGAAQVGNGQVFNGNETPFSNFSNFLLGGCQASAIFSTANPRVQNGLNQLLPSKQVGLVKLNVGAAVGLMMTPKTAKWGGIRPLHKAAITASTITISIVAPTC